MTRSVPSWGSDTEPSSVGSSPDHNGLNEAFDQKLAPFAAPLPRVHWIPAPQVNPAVAEAEEIEASGAADEPLTAACAKARSRAKAVRPTGATGNCKLNKRERNKASASKYRKKRKEYLGTLETKVEILEKDLSTVTKKCADVAAENKMLKEQLDFMKNLLAMKSVPVPGVAAPQQHAVPRAHGHSLGGRVTGLAILALCILGMLFSGPLLHSDSGSPAAPSPAARKLFGYPDVGTAYYHHHDLHDLRHAAPSQAFGLATTDDVPDFAPAEEHDSLSIDGTNDTVSTLPSLEPVDQALPSAPAQASPSQRDDTANARRDHLPVHVDL